jgi:hypothetical protein
MVGCTQAYVEVRHDRAARNAPPDTILSIGARWYFWDAYADHIADKVERAIASREKHFFPTIPDGCKGGVVAWEGDVPEIICQTEKP